jgi:uncharacterized iron-regulated protein
VIHTPYPNFLDMPIVHYQPGIARESRTMFQPMTQIRSYGPASRLRRRVALLLLPAILSGCATAIPPRQVEPHKTGHDAAAPVNAEPQVWQSPELTPALDLNATMNLEGIIPVLAGKRVVLVGETHDRYDNHLMQLEIIRRLHAVHPRLAIGMEAFQQPFQSVLDEYVAGRVDEKQLLRGTEYYRRWRFDFRHYAPILEYAREHHLPVVALNLPAELTGKVGREGIAGLTAAERKELPAEIDRSDTAYEVRLRKVFDNHPGVDGHGFENFVDVQLLWDEGMAERAADFLRAHPDYTLVVLAGEGHLAYGSGIPRRLTRRLDVESAIVLNEWDGTLESGLADYLLLPQEQSLPPSGKFGALLDEDGGKLSVDQCLPDSPCKLAGLQHGDQIIAIDGEAITDLADLRVATWDKRPGESVTIKVRRQHWFLSPQELSYEIMLR